MCCVRTFAIGWLDITVEAFRPTWRYKILKNESKYHHRKNSQRKFKGKLSFDIPKPACIFSRLFFYYLEHCEETTRRISIYTDSMEKRVIGVTQVTRELMKNISESTSCRWKVFGINGSFLQPDEILDKSTQVSFECRSRREEVTRLAQMVRPFRGNRLWRQSNILDFETKRCFAIRDNSYYAPLMYKII